MALFKNDVSEYVAPRKEPARLVVTFTHERNGDRYSVAAHVDDDHVATGQFVVNPEWRDPEVRSGPSKLYLPAAGRSLVGQQLFSALFSGALSRSWAQAVERSRQRDGLHIVIRSDVHAVQALPWELLSDPTLTSPEYIVFAEGWSVLRDFRGSADRGSHALRDPGRMAPLPLAELGVLVVLTNPLPGMPAYCDDEVVWTAFDGTDVRVVRHDGAKRIVTELEEADADIIHVAGAGRRSRQGPQALIVGTPDQGGGMLSAKAMTESLVNDRVRLVVLAACETDQFAAHVASVVPAVVGIRGNISEAGCQAFLGGFYTALASGSTVAQAVASGRAQQIGFSQSLGDEWAQPVLFQTHDGPLVLATAPGGDPATGQMVPAPQHVPVESRTERSGDFRIGIKEANLLALRVQWAKVVGTDTPAFVQAQIDRLASEVEALRAADR